MQIYSYRLNYSHTEYSYNIIFIYSYIFLYKIFIKQIKNNITYNQNLDTNFIILLFILHLIKIFFIIYLDKLLICEVFYLDWIETFLAIIFLGYFSYILSIIYNLIPIFIQIVFSYFIYRKNIFKIIITTFITQGIVLSISNFIYELIYSIYRHSKTIDFFNTITSNNFIVNIIYILTLGCILIGINYLAYHDLIKQKNYKIFISLLSCYLFNFIIMIFCMIKFKLFFI